MLTRILNLIFESLRYTYSSLIGNRLRSSLSLIGICLGVFSIVVVLSLIDSLKRDLYNQIDKLGKDVLYIQKIPWDGGQGMNWQKYLNRPSATFAELQYLKEECKGADAVSFFSVVQGKLIKHKDRSIENISLIGASYEYDRTNTVNINRGRYFTEEEVDRRSGVIILGAEVAETLFEYIDPIGKTVLMYGHRFKVIGLLEKTGKSLFGEDDNSVLIPITKFKSFVNIRTDITNPTLVVKAKNNVSLDELRDELIGVMRGLRRLKPVSSNNFAINDLNLIDNFLGPVFVQIDIVGVIIGLFSLLVGAFGISNIMIVSVKERVGEIGIQKSLGAKRIFILFQFLFESIVLCIIGGLASLILIYSMFYGLNNWMDLPIVFVLGWNNVIFGMVLSIVVGVVSGFLPARSAARLHPVDAIRRGD